MQPLSGRFHSSVQYLLSSLAPPHVTDNGYWAFPVNHTSHAHTIEYELWLILILSLTHGIPAVVWETRSLPVGEFSSPIARLARLLSSYDFLHSLPVSILQPCSSSGIFRQLDGIFSPPRLHLCKLVCPLSGFSHLPSSVEFISNWGMSATWDMRHVGLNPFFCFPPSGKIRVQKRCAQNVGTP